MGKFGIWILLVIVFGSMWLYLNRDKSMWGKDSEYCKSIDTKVEDDPEKMTRGDVLKGSYNVGDQLFHFLRGCE